MKLVHLSPGAGESFYCENCLRDAAMVLALRRRGHDAASVPLYLPLMTEEHLGEAARGEVFFGGINVYLQQKSALFRRTPRWLDRLFDSRRLLRWAGRRAGMTSAKEVGETMLSMLRGENGRQVKELERLVAFLAEHERPDVVSLSNALLVGVVRRIKQELDVPVICSLQDEHGYVEALPDTHRTAAWEVLRERAAEVDAFIAPSRFYGEVMRRQLDLPQERFHVIPNTIDASALAPPEEPPGEPAIGYLSQMCQGKGLDTLVEAFCRLKDTGRFGTLKLRVFGGMTDADEPFVRQVRGRLERAGHAGDAELIATLDPARKQAFLRSCSVVSVPTRQGEAFGLFVLEALACGVPVVLPGHGAFPELIEATGGGLLCEPNDPADLAAKIELLLTDPSRRAEMGRQGRRAVLEDFTPDRMAERVERLCQDLTSAQRT
ncbi:MAG TPA: glycosyltransferase family 4 protein [Phycisphaerae bacterium]|nr:glycosyltransferase family 4 protein [Phycisphaerae bacterium]